VKILICASPNAEENIEKGKGNIERALLDTPAVSDNLDEGWRSLQIIIPAHAYSTAGSSYS
jgi:hypothetical protein